MQGQPDSGQSVGDFSAYKRRGVRRLLRAFANSWSGLVSAYKSEAAFRQLLVLNAICIPVAVAYARSTLEALLLIIVVLQTLVVEIINAAIESVVDRISLEWHELSRNAKDMASAAQLISFCIFLLVWVVLFLGRSL